MSTHENTVQVLRLAAKRMEKTDDYSSIYPCWNIAEVDGTGYPAWMMSPNVKLFLDVFSDKQDTHRMSDDFIARISMDDRDACVLALCFAAAVLERP